jgi:hypothetical protein
MECAYTSVELVRWRKRESQALRTSPYGNERTILQMRRVVNGKPSQLRLIERRGPVGIARPAARCGPVRSLRTRSSRSGTSRGLSLRLMLAANQVTQDLLAPTETENRKAVRPTHIIRNCYNQRLERHDLAIAIHSVWTWQGGRWRCRRLLLKTVMEIQSAEFRLVEF